MRAGKLISCGVWPYLTGVRLTCRGYDLLKKSRVHIKRAYPDALSLQLFNRIALIGMTRGLRHKLDKVVDILKDGAKLG